MRSKGQVSIEILIVLSILIVGAIAFGIYYINHLNNNIKDQDQTNIVEDTVTGFVKSVDENEPMTVTITYNSGTCTANTKFAQGAVNCNWGTGTYGVCTKTPCSGTVTVIAKDSKDVNATATIII